MPELRDKLEAARAEVARLERRAEHATCIDLGLQYGEQWGREMHVQG
jgi:hypothetical protein